MDGRERATGGLGRPVEGVAWMVASGLSFVAMTGIVRHLGTDLPAAQGAFLRFALGLVFLAPAVAALVREGVPRPALRLYGGRCLVHAAAVVLWFFAMARLPVAEVTAIGYLNPVLVTAGAALIFGEALGWRRALAGLAALAGAMLVLRPGLREVTGAHLAQVGAAVFFAGSYLIAKRLTATEGAGRIVAALSVGVTLCLAPLAWWVWVPVGPVRLGWLLAVAGLATSGHYCMTRAFAAAPLAVTQPVTMLQLVWATALGVAVFADPVDPFVLAGGATIIGAVTWNTWRESAGLRGGPARGVAPDP